MPNHYIPKFTRYSTSEPGIIKPQAACGAYVDQVDISKPSEMPSCQGCQEWLYGEAGEPYLDTNISAIATAPFKEGRHGNIQNTNRR